MDCDPRNWFLLLVLGVASGLVRVQSTGRIGLRESRRRQDLPTGIEETAQHSGEPPLPPGLPGQEEEDRLLSRNSCVQWPTTRALTPISVLNNQR